MECWWFCSFACFIYCFFLPRQGCHDLSFQILNCNYGLIDICISEEPGRPHKQNGHTRCSLIVALLPTSPLRSAQFRGRSLLCVRQRLSQKCRCRWTEWYFLAGNLSNLGLQC